MKLIKSFFKKFIIFGLCNQMFWYINVFNTVLVIYYLIVWYFNKYFQSFQTLSNLTVPFMSISFTVEFVEQIFWLENCVFLSIMNFLF